MDYDTVANELLEEGNCRVVQRHNVDLARERLGEDCGKLEDVGTGGVHGDIHVRARTRGSPSLRAEEHGDPDVLAASEGVAQADSDILDLHRSSLPRSE